MCLNEYWEYFIVYITGLLKLIIDIVLWYKRTLNILYIVIYLKKIIFY